LKEIDAIGLLIFEWAGIVQSVKGPATGWSVQCSNSVQARDGLYSREIETDPGAHPACCAVVLRILQKKGGQSSTKIPRLRMDITMPLLCLCAFLAF